MNYFRPQYMLYDSNGYAIQLEEDFLASIGGMKKNESSVHYFPCKLLGLKYDEYLRLCRDQFNARIEGSKGPYVWAVFNDKKDCDKLCKILNERLNFMMKGEMFN